MCWYEAEDFYASDFVFVFYCFESVFDVRTAYDGPRDQIYLGVWCRDSLELRPIFGPSFAMTGKIVPLKRGRLIEY